MPGLSMVLTSVLLAASPAQGAPDPGAQGQLRFAVLGHARGDRTGALHYLLDEIVDEIARTDSDLLFLTGDMVFGDIRRTVDRAAVTKDWEDLDRALARTGAEVFRTPGNHDMHDAVTRDIWVERYGQPGQLVRRGGCLFVLLCSQPQPAGEGQEKEPVTPSGLPVRQLELLRAALADPDSYDHAFVFLHHLLWWPRESAWWTDVHPLLVAGKVRAVHGGDMGPFKFSHERRDGIDYVQSALSRAPLPAAVLQEDESSRLRQVQPDTLPVVTVRGDRIETQVLVLGALEDGRRTPEVWRAGYDDDAPPAPRARRGPSYWRLGAIGAALLAVGIALGRRLARAR